VPWEPNDNRTISFSLCPVVAEHTRKTPGSSINSCRERMHPQSTDGLSAQVALLQSRYLPNRPVVKLEPAFKVELVPASQLGRAAKK
jgi:hypothetical protein